MTALTSTEKQRRRNESLNQIAKDNGFDTWQRLTTAAKNGKAVIVTTDKIFEILLNVREGSIDMGDGLQGLVYATLYDVAKHLGLSQEKAEFIGRDDPTE